MNLKNFNWENAFNLWYKLQQYLHQIEDIIPLIPAIDDTKWQKATKIMSLANKVQEQLFPGRSEMEEINQFVKEQGLIYNNDAGFIKMMASSPLKFDFVETCITINKIKGKYGPVMYEYVSKHGSFFIYDSLEKIHKGSADAGGFWHKDGFDQEGIILSLWKKYNDCISVEGRGSSFTFSAVPYLADPVSKSARRRIDELGEKYREYQEANVPRTVMFVGPPGCGKTTAVLHLGKLLGSKTVRIESTSLSEFKPSEIRNFLSGLKPTCIIVDDIDRIDWREKSHILTVLEYIKMDNKNAVLLLTANRVSVLDPAFIRPGRIDEIQWYKLPNNLERRELFDVYMEHLDVAIPDAVLKKLVEMSRGLTGSWIKELVQQVKYSPNDDIFDSIESMIKLKNKVIYVYDGDINPDADEDEYAEDDNLEIEESNEKPVFDDMIEEMNHKEILAFLKACRKNDKEAENFLKKKLRERA